ncbi:MAG: hypothetical protein R3191_03225 [Anaerolineales bacterium]|nr:hypothetical protein [Anaerolineales bacterium]
MKRLRWLGLLAIVGLVLGACGPSGATPDPETGEIRIIQMDDEEGMNFQPETVVLTAGERVRIILENQGSKDHEFMVGQEVVYEDSGAPNGFETDFFEGIEDQVDVELGEGAMLMIDGETVAMGGMAMEEGEGDMEMEGEGEGDHGHEEGEEHEEEAEGEEHTEEEGEGMAMHMDHAGWMVMDAAGSAPTIIEFTVPEDRVGEWIMGCFEDDGTHFEDGMRGTLIVQAP